MRDIIENKEIKVNEKNIIPLAEIKEESDVTLNLELYKNNMPFDVTGQSIKLGLLINNELIGEQSDGITINKNVVTIKLKNSFIQPGKLELDLTLTDNTGRMTTSSFYLIVNKKTIGGTSIQGTDLLETLDKVILYFKVNSQKAIDGFIAENTELLSDIKKNGEKTINDIKSNYDSLKQIIIDENQAANLQEQINVNKNRIEQLEDLTPVWQEHEGQGNITANDSFDGVTKDLIIKGKTYFNAFLTPQQWYVPKTGEYASLKWDMSLLKTDTTYTILFFNVTSPKINRKTGFIGDKTFLDFANKNIDKPIVATTRSTFDINKTSSPHLYPVSNDDPLILEDVKDIKVMFIEGDCSANPPKEYFDSITSGGELEDNKIILKSIGKNLFDKNSNEISLGIGYSGVQNIGTSSNSEWAITGFIQVKPNTTYYKSGNVGGSEIHFFDKTKGWLNINGVSVVNGTFTTPSNCYYIRSNTRVSSLDTLLVEEGAKATNYEQFKSKLVEIQLPFEGGLKSLPNEISDEIYDNGKLIQKIEKRVYKTGDELLPNVITDKKNTIIELSEYKTYAINPFFLRTFNKNTHLYQENNICGEVSFGIAKDRDAIINGNTESISKLNEISVNQEEKIFSFYEELNKEIKKIKAHEIYNEEDLDNFIMSDYKAGIFKSDVIITTPKNLDRIDKVLNLNGFTLKLSDSYSYDYIFRIGETEYDVFNTKYIKWIKNGIIDINDKECYVLNHTFSWSLICEGIRIINAKKGFIKYTVSEEQTSRGAEAIFSDISIIGSGNIKNEQLAYDLWIGDSIYKNLFSQYFTYGVRTRVGGSIISNVHVWGVHNKAGRLNHIMKIGVINQAYYNIFENIIVDTPEVLSDELEPSVTNGGIAFYDELSSETRYDNCQILGNKNQKDKAIICFYLNKPENLADEYYGQSMIFDNCFTRETKKIHTGIHFTGKSRVLNITNCNIAINKEGKVRGYNQLTSNSTVFKKDTAQSTIDKIAPWSTCNQENSMQMENDDFGITILIRDKDKTGSWIRLMSGIDSVVNKEKVPEVLAYLNSAKKSGISGGIMRNIGFTVFNPSISENNVGRYEYYQYVPTAERFLIVRTGMLTTI